VLVLEPVEPARRDEAFAGLFGILDARLLEVDEHLVRIVDAL
jgi:hypothetical protein